MTPFAQPETDNLARMWLEAGDRAMRDGLPATATAFRNMAWRENPDLAESWPRWEGRCTESSE